MSQLLRSPFTVSTLPHRTVTTPYRRSNCIFPHAPLGMSLFSEKRCTFGEFHTDAFQNQVNEGGTSLRLIADSVRPRTHGASTDSLLPSIRFAVASCLGSIVKRYRIRICASATRLLTALWCDSFSRTQHRPIVNVGVNLLPCKRVENLLPQGPQRGWSFAPS